MRPVYLLTDNPDTQELFIQKYGIHRILVFQNISRPPPNASLAVDHRFTSLEHAALDIIIAAHATKFKPAAFSSVSDLVKTFNALHWYPWCKVPCKFYCW